VDPTVRLLHDLVAIDSVNPTLVEGAAGEAAIATVIADHLRHLGLAVSVDMVAPGRPNVVGVLEGRAPGRTLMFCGHTDTVGVSGMERPFSPEVRGGRLYGRGSQDMKGGVAAMIGAAGIVAQRGLEKGRVVVAAVVDEEHSSIGADALVKNWTADAAVVTEPTDLAIAVGHKGFEWIQVDVAGTAAHGSRPAEGEDAILRLGRVLARLESLDRDLQRRAPHALVGTASLHASTIVGGREWSSYPESATLRMERRTLPGEESAIGLTEVSQICADLRADDSHLRVQVKQLFSRPAYEIPRNHELPQTLAAVIAAAAGQSVVTGATFWTDAAILGGAGIPSVLYGPGGAGLHSIDEYVNLDDVLTCRDALAELAFRFC
jgi:acetylornithine deacetylase